MEHCTQASQGFCYRWKWWMMKKRFLLKLSNESLLFISTCWLVLIHWLFFAGDVIVGFLNNTVFQRHVFVFDLASLSLCDRWYTSITKSSGWDFSRTLPLLCTACLRSTFSVAFSSLFTTRWCRTTNIFRCQYVLCRVIHSKLCY